ncbi:MAG: hydrogenase maturation protease [Candidatus Eisenbacteria bacterium]
MRPPAGHTLILAFGNPARLDDGLGPAFAAALESAALESGALESGTLESAALESGPDVEICWDYHLQIEQATDVARASLVLFVDADRIGPAPFALRRIEPSPEPVRFTSHGVSPAGLLGLAEELHGKPPEAWLLGIRGYEFDGFGEQLSDGAKENLEAALAHVSRLLCLSHPSACSSAHSLAHSTTAETAGREHA